jgi:hypothetical protein
MDSRFMNHQDQMKPVVSQEKIPLYILSIMIGQDLEGKSPLLFDTRSRVYPLCERGFPDMLL